MVFAELVSLELGADEVFLMVGVVEAAVRVGAEGIPCRCIKNGLHGVAEKDFGHPFVVVVYELARVLPLESLQRAISQPYGSKGLLFEVIVPRSGRRLYYSRG